MAAMSRAISSLVLGLWLGLAFGACPFHYYLRPRVIDPATGRAVEEQKVIVVTASRIEFMPASQFKDQFGDMKGVIFSPNFQFPQALDDTPLQRVTEDTSRKADVKETTTKKAEVTTKKPEVTTKKVEEAEEAGEGEYDDYEDYDDEPKELSEANKKALALLNSINFDVDVKNLTLVEHRVACAVDDGPCDEIGEGVKGIIDFLQEDRCESCTSENRGDLYKGILVVKHQLPHRYKQLLDKYEGGVEPIELEAF